MTTSRYSVAADWLQHITGTSSPEAPEANSAQNEMLRDAYSMSDLEARAKAQNERAEASKKNAPVVKGVGPVHSYQQPKPKFISHKTPKSQQKKASSKSNRLGDNLHYA
uniref:Uncharacterized protein n=1 Tax=Trieres chinensis TaxID=1514140 RepID=A0A7S1YU48_TRICV|mmetsp:Transcript_10651/g.22310  ORF Transcript_10651/g.22310 Transcript_10651/m.22310 type:complete len:109 (+) Transcript_10651:137-463(+)